jgi:hypothetical protein
VSTMRSMKLGMLCFLASLLVGCGPSDIQVTDVKVIDVSSAPSIDKLEPIRDEQTLYFVVYFKSATDIRSFARRHEFTVNNEVSACSGGAVDKTKRLGLNMGVYDAFGEINIYTGVHTSSLREGEVFSYHLYFPVKVTKVIDYTSYDLVENTTDVCVLLDGGNMIGMGHRSNTIVIPRSVLSEALQKYEAAISGNSSH